MITPNFDFESILWRKGINIIAGLDEVGRGSFAGPVVAAACAFAPRINLQIPIFNKEKKIFIRDSKKLSDKQRRVANDWIKENCMTWGIGSSTVSEINKNGISKSTCSAFRRSVIDANRRLGGRVDYLLTDAFYIPNTRGYPSGNKNAINAHDNPQTCDFTAKQLAIVKGDNRSFSIASASIIAKVFRDDLMIHLSRNNHNIMYQWENNKGYGTKDHRDAIDQFGICRHHRKQFTKVWNE